MSRSKGLGEGSETNRSRRNAPCSRVVDICDSLVAERNSRELRGGSAPTHIALGGMPAKTGRRVDDAVLALRGREVAGAQLALDAQAHERHRGGCCTALAPSDWTW
jgi:hypothetical protein